MCKTLIQSVIVYWSYAIPIEYRQFQRIFTLDSSRALFYEQFQHQSCGELNATTLLTDRLALKHVQYLDSLIIKSLISQNGADQNLRRAYTMAFQHTTTG